MTSALQPNRHNITNHSTTNGRHVNSKHHTDHSLIYGHAEILEVMRQSIETRKTTLVELALDLIQRLIAHRALTGRVYSINHRRDLAAGVKGKRRGGGGRKMMRMLERSPMCSRRRCATSASVIAC